MLEPIDYRQALLQRWRLIVVAAVVGVLGGVLYPLHLPHPLPKTEYQTSTLIGVTPGGGPPTLGQIDFFAANQQVIVSAARSLGIKRSYVGLQQDITVGAGKKKKSSSPNGTVQLTVKQPGAKRSAKLANAYAKAIANAIQTELNTEYTNELNTTNQTVCDLEADVNSIDAQIAAIVAPNNPTQNAQSPGTQTANCTSSSSSGSATTQSAYWAPMHSGAQKIVLTAGTGKGTTTPTITIPTTTTTTIPPSTTQNNPALADLEAQRQSVTTQYVAALQKLQSLSDSQAKQSGLIVLDPANAAQAKEIPGGLSLLDHRSVRGLIGLIVAAAIASGIAILLAGLDKRLRTAGRAEETFGFPVIAQIPAVPRPRGGRRREPAPPPPPVPVLSAPSSPQAEAYRMMRMALELGSLSSTGAANGNAKSLGAHSEGRSNGNGSASTTPGASRRAGPVVGGATPLWVSDPSAAGGVRSSQSGSGHAGSAGRGKHHPAVLIVSPGAEPTRSLVVANLAATYAESGLRTYVVTTEDLRSDGSVPPAGLFEPPEHLEVDEVEASSTPTQIMRVRRLGLGRVLEGPGQLVSSAPEVVAICRHLADTVVVDAASMLSTYDAEALVPAVDTILVVGEAGMTTVDQARRVGDVLRRITAPVTGVVLTNVPPSREAIREARKALPLRTTRARGQSRSSRRAASRAAPKQPKPSKPSKLSKLKPTGLSLSALTAVRRKRKSRQRKSQQVEPTAQIALQDVQSEPATRTRARNGSKRRRDRRGGPEPRRHRFHMARRRKQPTPDQSEESSPTHRL